MPTINQPRAEVPTVAPDSQTPTPVWLVRGRSMRFPADDEVELELAHEPGVKLHGFLRDASSSCVRVALPRPLPEGCEVTLRLRDTLTLVGEVTYCRSARDIHYAGVAIHHGSGTL